MLLEPKKEYNKKIPKKITPQRLKNIALYYLKRFETSEYNLRNVLKRRIDDYAYWNKEFNKKEAYQWLDELVDDFVRLGYVNDERFAEIKIRGYLGAGKSPRYILNKLKEGKIEIKGYKKRKNERGYEYENLEKNQNISENIKFRLMVR